MCAPKELGGLGIKNLRTMNLALKMRWKWLELTNKERPWQGMTFSIPKEAEMVFMAALDCRVGNGKQLRFCQDPWIGGRTSQQIAPAVWQHVRRSDGDLSVEEAILNDRWV